MQRLPRRSLVLAARAAVLLAMAAGSVGYSLADKTVTISVDGQIRTMHTFAGDIASALNRAGITLGPHDVVAPALKDSLHDGSQIVIARARPLQLTVDGRVQTAWVTQPELGQAAASLGVRLVGAYVSTPPYTVIPASGLDLTVRLPQQVSLDVGGVTTTATTTSATVSDLLSDAGVALGPEDVVSVPLSSYPVTGDTIQVTRVTTTTWLQRDKIAISTLRVADAHLRLGRVQLAHQGRAGMRYRLWSIVRVDGTVVSQTLISDTSARVKDKVIRYGTQPKAIVLQAVKATRPVAAVVHHTSPAATRSATRSASRAAPRPPAAAPRTTKGAGLDWPALARCESGGNPREVDGPYYGLYQFTLGTWAAVGGHGKPSNASSAEQTYRAKLLYAQQGRSPWPACGRFL